MNLNMNPDVIIHYYRSDIIVFFIYGISQLNDNYAFCEYIITVKIY